MYINMPYILELINKIIGAIKITFILLYMYVSSSCKPFVNLVSFTRLLIFNEVTCW